MENKIKKVISTLVIWTILVFQIGCAGQVTRVSLSNAAFDPKYSYTIKTHQNINFPNVPGAEIQNLPDRIYIKQNGETKYLLHNQITEIDGTSTVSKDSNTGRGALIGAASLGIASGVLTTGILFFADQFGCPEGEAYGPNACQPSADPDPRSWAVDHPLGTGLLVGLIGSAVGAGIGAAIGSGVHKKSKVRITPTFSQTQTSTNAGANLSIRF